jgi:hypothetical protein
MPSKTEVFGTWSARHELPSSVLLAKISTPENPLML